MSLSIEDLRPKNFKIIVRGVELDCEPLQLSHTLAIASITDTVNNIENASKESLKRIEQEILSVISEIIPSLTFKVDGSTTMEIITQLMTSTTPSDVDYLNKNGVKLNASPKAEKVG